MKKGIDEHDLTHLSEILKLHDFSMDPKAGNLRDFIVRSKDNFNNRCLHHHVFTSESVVCITDYVDLKILVVATHPPSHIIVFGKKVQCTNNDQAIDLHHSNCKFLQNNASWRASSCFGLDQNSLEEYC
jgi:hypothetical protein